MATGEAGAVGFGRLFIANPDLPGRFRRAAAPNAPQWPAYTAQGDQLMNLAAQSSVRQNFRKSQLDAQEREWRRNADSEARGVEEALRQIEDVVRRVAPP